MVRTPPLLQRGGGSFVSYGVKQEGSGSVAYVPQRGGRDFTGPPKARPGLPGLVCPCYHVRSAPVGGGGGRPPGGRAAAALRLQWPGVLLSRRPVGYRLWR